MVMSNQGAWQLFRCLGYEVRGPEAWGGLKMRVSDLRERIPTAMKRCPKWITDNLIALSVVVGSQPDKAFVYTR